LATSAGKGLKAQQFGGFMSVVVVGNKSRGREDHGEMQFFQILFVVEIAYIF
jgi:hypothetical protein